LTDWRRERSEQRLRPWGHAITRNQHATIRPGPARRPRLRCGRPVPEDNLEMINEPR
jgi:hypothetical protein